MRQPKRRARDPTTAELTENMADAVTYLSRVAHDAGLETISTDLLSISSRLRDVSDELAGFHDEMTTKFSADICKRKH
jgi:methionine synthase II (cobalamin-independent)